MAGKRRLTMDEVMLNDSREMAEQYDCAVRAVTIVTGISYKRVHAAFRLAGRKNRRMTGPAVTGRAVRALGFRLEGRAVPKGTTIGNMEERVETDRPLLVWVSGHMSVTDNRGRIFGDGFLKVGHRVQRLARVTRLAHGHA